jgi:ubiquitin C-terminal hydrolase
MTIDDHHDRPVIALDRSVIFLDNDDNAEPFNTTTSGGEDDLETKSKNLHAANVIIRNLTLLRTKNAVGDSLQNLKASVQSCFRNGVDKNTTKDTTGAHSSNSSKHNDSSSSTLPLGLNQLNDFIIKAEYECNQDPYRGIGRLRQRQTVHDQPSSRGEVVEDDVPTTGGPSLRETNGGKIPTPAVHQEDMYLSPLLWGTTTDPHELTLRTRSSRKKKNVSPWDACRWGILSTNDVVNDSGSDSQIEAEDTNHKLGPSSSSTSKESVGPFEPGNPENVVKCLTESCCPSLLAWTKQRIDQDFKTISQQNRKRRNVSKRSRSESDTGSTSVVEVQLGQRPSGSNYRCPCDSNPYCLTSLGGVVNDILMERCKDVTVKIATEDDGNSKRNTVDNNDTKMHDNTRNGKRKKSDVVEKPKLLQKWLDKSLGPLKKKKGEELWYRNVASKVSNFSDTEDAPPDDDDDEVVVVVDAEVVVKSPTKVPTITDNTGGKEESNPISLHIRNTDAVAVPVGRDNSNSLENEWGKSHNLPNVAASVVPSSLSSHRMQTFVVTSLQSQSSNSQALNDKDNPGDIYFQTEEDEKTKQYSNETNYSQETQEELDRLRIYQDLEREQIEKFVLSILERVQAIGGNVDDQDEPLWSLDEYLKAIVDWNRSLLFASPIKQDRQVGSLEITIGLPPGIQNLGATCYLNTQLQCLAQIPAFLDGIFSWRVVNSNHNMNPVMTNLQKLLAKMLVGGERKMSTQAFSDALGLEHHEQQDPNEFGRLLFDRMEESFQQCGSATNNGDYGNKKKDVGDLAHLLERIFRGTTTYETTCKNCGRTSARSEDFTDLNLPIVRRPSELDNDSVSDSFLNNDKSDQSVRTISRTKGLSKTAFWNNADTDVQYCFDKYAMAEVLEGDNQYHCSHCNSKQDAERVLKLTKLPPVLNVQLSRYVFDRVKFVKKKLMDKVLLPKTLMIGREVGSPAADPAMQLKEKRYVLCAVMRHHGTSAYSGHYIAEAIDWTTGLWYEFNDETVKVLPQGPSCSYIPIIRREGLSTDRDSISLENESVNFSNGSQVAYDGSISGSQDAYNMYYVDEDYLARNALNALVKRQMNILNTSVKDTQSENGVLRELIMERKTKYSVLSE